MTNEEKILQAINYFESQEEMKKQDGNLDYFNFDDRLKTLINAAKTLINKG